MSRQSRRVARVLGAVVFLLATLFTVAGQTDATPSRETSANAATPNWQFLSGTPFARGADGPVAFDSRRGVMVMYGGGHDPQYLGDTWEYDGVRWRSVSTPHTPPVGTGTMTFDSRRGVMVLYI